MAQIIVLTPEAKSALSILLFNAIQAEPDDEILHAIYSDVVSKKFK